MDFPNKKYQIIYADPPWQYGDKMGNDPAMGGITYPTMSLQQIKNLPVRSISADNCALLLWGTMPMLPEAIEVIRAWGFDYVTCAFNWIKLNPSGSGIYSGMGHWTNGNAELVFLGRRGVLDRKVKNVKQIQMHPRTRHSEKPGIIRREIVRLFGDIPRIELFARHKVEGWDVWGNQIPDKEVTSDIFVQETMFGG